MSRALTYTARKLTHPLTGRSPCSKGPVRVGGGDLFLLGSKMDMILETLRFYLLGALFIACPPLLVIYLFTPRARHKARNQVAKS